MIYDLLFVVCESSEPSELSESSEKLRTPEKTPSPPTHHASEGCISKSYNSPSSCARMSSISALTNSTMRC